MTRLEALLLTDKKTKPIPQVLPIHEAPAGAVEAVLLLHGFTGNPSELAETAAALTKAGYAVSVPRLPGHGTCRADFLQTRADDWVRRAFDSYMDLAASYEAVHVVGHSMGGLLATAVAAAFDVPKLVLLAPAFAIVGNGLTIAPFLAPFRPVVRRDRPLASADVGNPIREALHRDYWADDLVSGAAELSRLRDLCIRRLGVAKARMLVIAGDQDTTVPVEVVEFVTAKAVQAASVDTVVLPGAGHLFPFDEHAKETAGLVLDFIRTRV
jgi:carboxylesterase